MGSEVASMVREFHERFYRTMRFQPMLPAVDERLTRHALLHEEFEEYRDAEAASDIEGIADALGDMVYVIYGTALTYGIDLDAVIDEIHASNMTKLADDGLPLLRPDGKVLKGPNYEPPNIKEVLWPGSSTAPSTDE